MFHGLWIQMRWLWGSRRNTDRLQWETLSSSLLPISKTCPYYKTFEPTAIQQRTVLSSWVSILESNLGITGNFEGSKKNGLQVEKYTFAFQCFWVEAFSLLQIRPNKQDTCHILVQYWIELKSWLSSLALLTDWKDPQLSQLHGWLFLV